MNPKEVKLLVRRYKWKWLNHRSRGYSDACQLDARTIVALELLRRILEEVKP